MHQAVSEKPTNLAPAYVTQQLFDRMLASPRTLLAIETPRGSVLLEQFRQFAVRTGNSIYVWSDAAGISSLREGEVSISGSSGLPEALRFVQLSRQFGVYLFSELGQALRSSQQRFQTLSLLRQIAQGPAVSGHVRKVVLIEAQVDLPPEIDELIEHFSDQPGEVRQLRLRGGAWTLR